MSVGDANKRKMRNNVRMMRKTGFLDAIMPRIRQKLLATTILQPDRSWYLSELASHLAVRPSSLQRELASLSDAVILTKSQDGNRTYYRANTENPLFPDLEGLLRKTIGLADVLRSALFSVAEGVDFAFAFGSFGRGDPSVSSDIDLFVVGKVPLSELASPLRIAEVELQRSINPVVMAQDELISRLANRDHFVAQVLTTQRLFIIGDENDLANALEVPKGTATRHKQTRA
jgi:DNA-binding transcriptional ArsR family regulator